MTPAAKKAIVAILIIVILGGFGTYLKSSQVTADIPPDFSTIPFDYAGYIGAEHRFDDYAYEVLKADTTTLRLYRDSESKGYWLFMAYFSSQKYGSQIHSPKHCLPGGGFHIESIEPFEIQIPGRASLMVNRLLIANPQRKELMLYWFETRGGVITSEYGLKVDLMKNALLLRPTDAAICRLTMPLTLTANFDEATAKAVEFIQKFYPLMEQALPFDK